MNWRVIGWATAAGAFLSAASWGWFESSRRAKIEADREQAQDRLTATVQKLAETQQSRANFESKLTELQTEQEDLSRRFVENKLQYRTSEDTWLTDKEALLIRIKQLERKLRLAEQDLLAEQDILKQEKARRTRAEAVLAAERDVNQEASQRWSKERKAADDLARKQGAALQSLQKDLGAAQAKLQSNESAVKRLETDLSKTLDERDAAAVASQQTGAALDQAVSDLRKREYDIYSLQNTVAQLLRKLNSARSETQRLQRTNQQLVRQIQQLQQKH